MNFTLKIFAAYFVFFLISCSEEKSNEVMQNSKEIKEAVAKSETKKIKNVILMIGDGMGITQITAGMYRNGNILNLERCKVIGLQKTHSHKNLITDSAAGATAMATGKKTKNMMISQAPTDSSDLKTILEYAEEKNLATGVVSTSSVTHATPACFYAHYPSRNNVNQELAVQFPNSGCDVLIGGGKNHFTERKDGRNLLDELAKNGYTIIDNIDQQHEATDKLICLAADKHMVKYTEGRGDFLNSASVKAIKTLEKSANGFFLMIEGSQIDWGGHDNDSEYIINEMIDFDKAIGSVLDFAEKDGETLVIITADHETGGYAINGGNLDGSELETDFTTPNHTADMVPVFAFGPGAEMFSGIYDNTEIFNKIMVSLGLSTN